jgi:hypothetical protein
MSESEDEASESSGSDDSADSFAEEVRRTNEELKQKRGD